MITCVFQGQPPPQFPQQLWRHFYLSDKSEFHEKPQFYVTSSSQSVAFSYLVKAKVTLVSWHGGGDDKGHLQFLQWGWESTTVVDHNGLWFHWLFTLALAGGTLHVAALSLTMNKWNPCFGVLGCDLRNYVSTFQTIVQLSYFFFCLRSSMLKSTLRVDTLTISFKMGTLMRSIDN